MAGGQLGAGQSAGPPPFAGTGPSPFGPSGIDPRPLPGNSWQLHGTTPPGTPLGKWGSGQHPATRAEVRKDSLVIPVILVPPELKVTPETRDKKVSQVLQVLQETMVAMVQKGKRVNKDNQ